MFKMFTKKISSAFKTFDKGFEEMEEAFDQLDVGLEGKTPFPGPGVEQETVTEEVRPDGTRVTTRTVVRRTK